MKHFFLLLSVLTVFVACKRQNDYAAIVDGNPIMPVRLYSPAETVYMTDYVPLLAADKQVADTITLVDSGYIYNLAITGGKYTIYIPVIPAKPQKQGIVASGYNNHRLTVSVLEPADNLHIVAYIQNNLLPAGNIVPVDNDGSSFSIYLTPVIPGRSFLRVFAEDSRYIYNDILIPMQDGEPVTETLSLTRHDQQAQVLYSLLVDRFMNGNTANDWKMNSSEVLDIVDYQGGDLAGITQVIENGYFDNLGINTIWISPITQNPWDAWGLYRFKNGNKYDDSYSYTKFSGYHGYWPISITNIDTRFGTPDELKRLLNIAHQHGINVILDYVANHMHINAPTFVQHPTWHTDSILPDGRRNFELWDEARLTTWFDSHIPTLDLERPDVCEPMTDSALFWLEHYDLDGFRHDACKHIPETYWRLFGQKLAKRFPYRPIWMIGETYGSPQLISQYVKSGLLNAQFDFNVYFTAIHALCNDGTTMKDVNNTVLESLRAYGSHHTMGNISGNHDQVRFASLAGGAVSFTEDPKEAGWTRNIGLLPDDIIDDSLYSVLADNAYRRTMLLEVLNLTIPGVPCIYQGDEYAEVGGGDPDNRHMMRFDADLTTPEHAFREQLAQLIQLRRTSMPLMYGEYIPVKVEDDILIYDRVYLGETVRITIDRNTLTYSVEQL